MDKVDNMLDLSVFSNWWSGFLWGNINPIQPIEESETTITETQKQEMKSYFTINELIASVTADNLHINNTPTEEIKKHLTQLIEFLNELREAWGSPIRISSGYRCEVLNKAVGGSPTSVHPLGWAADTIPVNGKMKEYKAFCKQFAETHVFDQCLLEKSKTSEWVHWGLYNSKQQQRRQVKILNV